MIVLKTALNFTEASIRVTEPKMTDSKNERLMRAIDREFILFGDRRRLCGYLWNWLGRR